VEDPCARSGPERFGSRTGRASRIEQPPLEDDPYRPLVADEDDVRNAESRETRDELLAQAELAVRAVEKDHHHRHVPLLETEG